MRKSRRLFDFRMFEAERGRNAWENRSDVGSFEGAPRTHACSDRKSQIFFRIILRNVQFLLGLLTIVWTLTSCETTSTSRSGRSDVGYRRPPAGEFRGVWIYDPRTLDPDTTVRTLKEAGFNALFVRLSSAGAAYYPSKVLPMAPGTNRDYAQAYADAGKKYGMQIHAWHVCFMMHHAPSSDIAAAIKNGEVMRNAAGRALRPTYKVPVRTPALASNRRLEERAMVELVEKYPLAGVQFDYIRYFSPAVDFSATARAAFEKSIGFKVKQWPKRVTHGDLTERYHRWKADQVTAVVRETSRAVRTARPGAKVSAAVWHSPDVGYKDYAQDWVGWVRAGYLDFVVPMDYTTSSRVLEGWVERQKDLVEGRIPLYPGLGAYMINSPSELNRQIDICRRAGLPGYVLYNYDERLKIRFLSEIHN